MENKVYETTTKNFLNGQKECRIVLTDFDNCLPEENQYLVLKDMFDCLDKLDATGNITGHDKKKVVGFLEDMGWQDYLKELRIISNSTKNLGPKTVSLPCVRLDVVPLLLARISPNKNTPAYHMWVIYMHYINQLLLESRVLEKMNLVDKVTKPFKNVLLTSAQGAKMADCRSGAQFIEILEKIGLIVYEGNDIISYKEDYLDCTKRTVRIKFSNVPELIELVKEFKFQNNIEDKATKRKRKRTRVRCVETGHIFNSMNEAQRWLGKGNVCDCVNGIIKTTGGYHFEKVED